ncbi:zinc finger domain-containing protein [Streptomyces aculeolatus]
MTARPLTPAERDALGTRLAVMCTGCGAQPGDPCTSHGGTRIRRTSVHRDRTHALAALGAGISPAAEMDPAGDHARAAAEFDGGTALLVGEQVTAYAAAVEAATVRTAAERITAFGKARGWSTWAADFIHPDREFADTGAPAARAEGDELIPHPAAAVEQQLDATRAQLTAVRSQLDDVKRRRDDARAGRRDAERALDRVRQANTLGEALAVVAQFDGMTPQAAAAHAALTDRADTVDARLAEQAREHAVKLAAANHATRAAEQRATKAERRADAEFRIGTRYANLLGAVQRECGAQNPSSPTPCAS